MGAQSARVFPATLLTDRQLVSELRRGARAMRTSGGWHGVLGGDDWRRVLEVAADRLESYERADQAISQALNEGNGSYRP